MNSLKRKSRKLRPQQRKDIDSLEEKGKPKIEAPAIGGHDDHAGIAEESEH